MFAKAPRFPAGKPSNVPPPGFYDPKDIDGAPYRRSGFLEKSDRKLFDNIPDGPGPSQYQSLWSDQQPAQASARRVSVSSAGPPMLKQQVQDLTAENARITKESQDVMRRLEAKLEQAEARVRDLVKEKGTLQSDIATLTKEQRLALERETATRTALEKAESQAKQSSERASKYVALQRRLADLEKLHSESKSKFVADRETLRSQLETAQNLAAERHRQLDHLLSQHESDERHLHELKRAHGAAEKENQILRQGLQLQQTTSAEAESSRAGKERLEASLRLLEVRHGSECSELKRKISVEQSEAAWWKQQHQDVQRILGAQMQELEKRIAILSRDWEEERQRKQAEDTRARDRHSDELRDCGAHIQRLEMEIRQARDNQAKCKEALMHCEVGLDRERTEHRDQLQHIRNVMGQVAEQYGRLVMSIRSLSKASQADIAQTDGVRIALETKLATKESSIRSLQDALHEVGQENGLLIASSRQYDALVTDLLKRARFDHSLDRLDSPSSREATDLGLSAESSLQMDLSQLQRNELLSLQACTEAEVYWIREGYDRLSRELQTSDADRHSLQHQLDEAETECATLQSRTADMERQIHVAEASAADLTSQLATVQAQLTLQRDEDMRIRATYQAESNKLTDSLTAEKAYTAQLRLELAHGKAREAALAVEIDNLHDALAECEGYKREYQSLLGEVKIILSRNALAEDEAERLSRFNAEILGHQNPSQKILYVDKMRRELAEVKQKLIVVSLERDDTEEAKRHLLDELATYKSIAVPLDSKPRSTMTRVAKVTLGSRSVNNLTRSLGRKKAQARPGDGVEARESMATWPSREADGELRVEDLRLQ